MKIDVKEWAKRELLEGLEIIPHYQPVVNLVYKKVFGYEALSRFRLKGDILNPLKIFRMAENMDLAGDLDIMCRETAITEFPKIEGVLLFLNVFPSYIASDYFGKRRTFEFVVEAGLKPELVVLEITEVEKLPDINLFKRALSHYKDMGFCVGIDDIGTGYNSLQLLLELEGHLDFVKIPRELVDGVSRSKIKHQLVKVLTEVSLSIGAKPIYEGVEQEEDIKVLFNEIGAELIQGFYFAKPMPKEDVVKFNLNLDFLSKFEDDYFDGETLEFIRINPEEKFGRFLEILENYNSRYVAIELEQNRYLVDLWKLFYSMNHIKRNLYYYKDVGEVIKKLSDFFPELDSFPQFFPDLLKVANTVDALTSSHHEVVLIKGAKGIRVIERQALLDILYRKLSKELLDKNPLTQLPGNNSIKEKIEELSKSGKDFYICYLDLDNFKAFNDAYGFYAGDQMIKKVGFLLKFFQEGDPLTRFVGHIGGDDFVVILWTPNVHHIANELVELIRDISKELLSFYSKEDIQRGYFLGKDRGDNIRELPVASVSAVLLKGSSDMLEISKRSAVYKKKVKAHKGSALFVEHLNEILTIDL